LRTLPTFLASALHAASGTNGHIRSHRDRLQAIADPLRHKVSSVPHASPVSAPSPIRPAAVRHRHIGGGNPSVILLRYIVGLPDDPVAAVIARRGRRFLSATECFRRQDIDTFGKLFDNHAKLRLA
jgi:hypothetical protein